jgi:iron donor protein CyaY
MEENIFSTYAHNELTNLFEILQSPGRYEDLDVDLQDDVLYITLPDKRQYVINKHTPSQQIWLSSPLSGAGYYTYKQEDQNWYDKKNTELNHLIISELTKYE